MPLNIGDKMEYDNNNRGAMFLRKDGVSYEGKININGVEFDKVRAIKQDGDTNSHELVLVLGSVFMNDVEPDSNRPLMNGNVKFGETEINFAGWKKFSKKGTEYISCKVDKPFVKEEKTPFDD